MYVFVGVGLFVYTDKIAVAHVAQQAERNHGKVEVTGSIPVVGSIISPWKTWGI